MYFGEASIKNGIAAQKVIDELKQRPKLVVEKVTSANSAMLKCQNCGSKIIISVTSA
jgi:hypothetical protein